MLSVEDVFLEGPQEAGGGRGGQEASEKFIHPLRWESTILVF